MNIKWITGFFEGEGSAGAYSIRYYKDKKYNKLIANINQKDREILDKIKEFFGFGNIVKCKKNDKYGKRYCHRWQVSCKQARLFLNKILPHLQSKYKINQVKIALKKDAKSKIVF